jgi:hypothetical protein
MDGTTSGPEPRGSDPLDGPLDGPLDDLDATLLAEVRALWGRLDPVPAGLAERSKFALTMHSLEAELAELTRPEPALTRLDDEVAHAESVTFTSSRASLLVTVTVLGSTTARLDGWVTVAGAVVRVHADDGEQVTTADDAGRFTFDEVRRGPVRFALWPDGPQQRPVVTPPVDV